MEDLLEDLGEEGEEEKVPHSKIIHIAKWLLIPIAVVQGLVRRNV